ncbi:hypothetical protein ACTFIZ_005715 [Dictyostelium cf. discoideum]
MYWGRLMKLQQALIKICRYFQNPSSVALLFERVNSILYPSSIVSFDTQQLTNNDVNKFNHLTNHSPITGCLPNNNIVNNALNNPIFILNITPQILYDHPNVPGNVGPFSY